MDRRTFLALAAIGVSGCATVPRRAARVDESVAIIGAGLSGLAAARQLRNTGYRVTVLEARDRPGGRVYTNRSLGAPIELGAERLHGTKGHPLMPFVERTGLTYVPVDWSSLSGYQDDGTPFDESALCKTHERVISMMRLAWIRNIGQTKDVSIETIIEREMGRREMDVVNRRMINFGLVSAEMFNASPFSEASWKLANDYVAYPGGDQQVLGGFDKVPQALAEGLEIHFGEKVNRIDYAGARVRVETTGGTLEADRAIVTVPLGVLKANRIAFVPELPAEKLAAIDRVGMGVFNIVALRFEKAFWPMQVHALVHGTDVWGDYPVFVNLAKYTGEPILLAYVPARFEDALEGQSDEQAIGGAVEVLRKMYGAKVPIPQRTARTRWGANPMSHGVYSYNRLGQLPDDRDSIGATVANRLFFAGEATSRDRYGCVAGAYLTGQDAALRVIGAASKQSYT